MKKITPILCTLLFVINSVNAQVSYVTPSGAGLQNGASWSNAFAGSALSNLVGTATYGTQVWVAAGIYKPAVYSRDTDFTINNGVQVYGGFAGTETMLSERNWNTNVTILSGDVGAPGIDSDNSKHVVHFTGIVTTVDSTTTIDGFTIEHGYATQDTFGIYSAQGGGILNELYSNPTVRNCIIQNNYAEVAGSGMSDATYSGWMGCHISNCQFLNNYNGTATEGGALVFYSGVDGIGLDTNNIFSVVDSCTFIGNINGAIAVFAGDGNCSPTISNCVIRNTTGSGIAITGEYFYYGNGFNVNIKNCVISNNHMLGYGGAIYSNTFYGWSANITIDGCTIDSNTSGIQFITDSTQNANYKVLNTSFSNNWDTLWNGTSDFNVSSQTETDTLLIANCTIDNNIPGYLGTQPELYVYAGGNGHSYISIINSTFYKQTDTSGPFGMTHILTDIVDPSSSVNINIENSILYCAGVSLYTPITYVGSSATMHVLSENSIISASGGSGGGWTAFGTDGGGNLNVYPKFVDTLTGNLHLACGSPAVNAGNNSLVPSFLLTDFDSTARIKEGTVDIGAYELDTTICSTLTANNIAQISSVSISPNPASDEFTVNYPGIINSSTMLSLYTITGQLVYFTKINAASTEVPVMSLANGIYVCSIISGGKKFYLKVVVAH